jgi:lipooligosaccharide transport system permease protein
VTTSPALRIVERELITTRKLWFKGWLISSIVMPALYLSALGVGLGGAIEGDVGGVSYLHFLTPGLLCGSLMQQAAGDSMWPVLGGVQWDGRYLAMTATPLEARDVHRAQLIWAALRTTASGAIFLVIAALLGGLASPWAVLALPAGVLTGVAFAAGLAGFAIRQRSDDTLALVFRLGIMPVFLLSGTFFPIDQLPAALQPVAWLSPLFHGVELARHAATADPHWFADGAHAAILLLVIVAAARWGRRGFERRLAS